MNEHIVALVALSSHRPNGVATLYGLQRVIGWGYDPVEFYDHLATLENFGRIYSQPVAVCTKWERDILLQIHGEYDAELASDIFEERRHRLPVHGRFHVPQQVIDDIIGGLQRTRYFSHRDFQRLFA